jgi:hypothetical protein
VAGGAEVAARRDVGQHLPVAVHEVGEADHRRADELRVLAPVAFRQRLVASVTW